MRKFIAAALSVCIALPLGSVPVSATESNTETISYNYSYDISNGYTAENVHNRQMEKLGRGLVAVKSGNSVYLSWRLLDSEDTIYGSADKNVSFNIYRNGTKIATESLTTNYTDTTAGTSYAIAPVIDGVEGEKCEPVSVQNNSYFDIPLQKPEPETVYDNNGNVIYNNISFSPTDCSAGDVDGDGEYEIIIKWVSSEHDVGSPGDAPYTYSGTVRFAAYKLDGTKLWDNDINLGKNVYSSAHTVQFLVYDFDGDGKAEMMCQTSLGSKDAKGNYVSHSARADAIIASTASAENPTHIAEFTDEENEAADYRNPGWGLITTGEEFLTVFDGETGEAVDTIDLPTARGNAMDWGDANATAGNRVNRFVADVAYLDGEKPYAIYLRGYYFGKDNNGRQRTSIAGISFDGERLSPDYRFDTKSGQPGYYEGAYQYVGNGNHNCTVADVDNDGKDEFITGALCMEVKDDNTFKPRWCTFMEHGDALHIGDYDPTHKGLEFFTVHEDSGPNKLTGTEINYGMSVIDADTGEIIKHWTAAKDTGRGMMANVGAGGYYQVNAGNQVNAHIANGGSDFTDMGSNKLFSNNFRIFWDGDLYDELLDGTGVTSWNGSGMSSIFDAGRYGCVKINGTKSNPALQADLFGDWREELVYPTSDGNNLRVFTTTAPTNYKIKTLMHDPVYRSGVAAEQTAYNQPPHVGFYMDDETLKGGITEFSVISFPSKMNYTIGEELDISGLELTAVYKNGTTEIIDINDCQISGYSPYESGTQTVTVTYKDNSVSFDVTVLSKVEFDADTALITGYKGTNSVITIPEYIDGVEVKGISDGAFENVTAKDIYIYHNVSIGDNVFPEGVTIHCFEWSTVKEYAESNGIKVEYISTDKAYANITFEESEYSDVTYIAIGTADTRIGNITYHPGVRSDKGNLSNSGAIRKVTQDGNSYLAVSAKRFANSNRHAKFDIENLSGLNNADGYEFSIDFRIQANTKGLHISILSEDGAEITNIRNGENIAFDTWYHLSLSFSNNVCTKTITDMQGNVISTEAIPTSSRIKTIACPVSACIDVENYVYFDNINITSKITSALTVSVTDSEGTPVGDAEITFGDDNDFTAMTDANGQAVVIIPAGVYTIKVTSAYIEDFEQENFAVYAETQVKHITLNGTLPSNEFKVEDVNGSTVVVNTPELDNVVIYAAKYNGGVLEIVEQLTPTRPYRNTFNLTFEPDKIFVWTLDMAPLTVWTNE